MVDRRALLSYARANGGARDWPWCARAARGRRRVRPFDRRGVDGAGGGRDAAAAAPCGGKGAARPSSSRGAARRTCSTALWATVELSAAELPALRCVCLGGEAMAPALIRRWAAALHRTTSTASPSVPCTRPAPRARRRRAEPPAAAGERRPSARRARRGCSARRRPAARSPSSTTPPPRRRRRRRRGQLAIGGPQLAIGYLLSRSSPPSALYTSTASGSTSPAISRSGTAASSASSAAPTARCSCAG